MAKARPTDFRDPDYTEVFRERSARVDKIRDDNAWHLMKRYYADGNYVDFIEDWCVTYDPRNVSRGKPAFVPFMLFPLQARYIAWLQDRKDASEDGLCEKSRDMGISWCSLAFALCEWLFSPGAKISFGSRKEDLVDKLGDPDSLLEKVRIMIRYLPEELRPQGYDEQKHARFMKIVNPQNGAIITGEAGDNIGRGGRSMMYFVDEAAFLERPERIDAALSQNTSSRIDVSTPNGRDNPFAQKRFGGHIPVFTFHWHEDPRKDQAWYDNEKRRLDPAILAQEVDLDYEASGEDTVIKADWVRASQALRKYLRENGLLPVVMPEDGVSGLDIGGGKAENCYIPRWGPMVGEPVGWVEADTTAVAYKARALAKQDGVGMLKYDAPGVGLGVASTLKRLPDVTTQGVNTGSGATKTIWPDGEKAKDKFQQLKAELWWIVRDRLRKTHEHWEWITSDGMNGCKYEIEELLLLPNDRELCSQLAIPGYTPLLTGKIQIERKDQLKARGVASPDRADTLMLTFAPAPPVVRVGRTTGVI